MARRPSVSSEPVARSLSVSFEPVAHYQSWYHPSPSIEYWSPFGGRPCEVGRSMSVVVDPPSGSREDSESDRDGDSVGSWSSVGCGFDEILVQCYGYVPASGQPLTVGTPT